MRMRTFKWKGQHGDGDKASATKSYHNGGVEGDAFADWYDKMLAGRYSKGSGTGGTKGSGSGGTKGSGSGGTKGSGSGGTKGSGTGGTKGSGTGGSCGTAGSGNTVRESFEWDLAPDPDDGGAIDNQDSLSGGFTQNTGNVDVTFSVLGAGANVISEFYTADQNTDGIVTDGDAADPNSAFSSFIWGPDGEGQSASYELGFSESVSNVSFRINDIDADALVRVQAFDADGNQIPISLTAGASIVLLDTDTVTGADLADSIGPDVPSNTADASMLVDIAGPVARIVIDHSQNGPANSGIDVTDVYFDVEADCSCADASSTSAYHNGGVEGDSFDSWYDTHLADKYCDPNGSGSGGTKGSGSGGTRGSGSGGTKGSGSGGTKGSGSGGTKGSGYHAGAAQGLPAYTGDPQDDEDDGDTVVYASGSGGSGGTQGSGAAGSGPSLDDIMGLMTVVPDDDDPSLIDPDDEIEDDPDILV